jgi:WXG100 family type VII secretion target
MSSDVIQAKYDELETIARQFAQRAQLIGELRSQLQRSAQPLEQGGWQGRGSAAFFREMTGQIFPATLRLRRALEDGSAVTLQASEIMRRAEQ